MEEQPVQIVIIVNEKGPPCVACSVDAEVHISNKEGYVHTNFPASSLLEMAAKGLAKR